MCRVVLALLLAIGAAGCGGEPTRRVKAPPTKAEAPTQSEIDAGGPEKDSSFHLPRLGTFMVRCPGHGPYTIRYVVDPEHATERLRVHVGGRLVKDTVRDPGYRLLIKVPVTSHSAGNDAVTETPTVVWQIVAESEPHTLRGVVRLRLANADDGPPPLCRFPQLRTSMVTVLHTAP